MRRNERNGPGIVVFTEKEMSATVDAGGGEIGIVAFPEGVSIGPDADWVAAAACVATGASCQVEEAEPEASLAKQELVPREAAKKKNNRQRGDFMVVSPSPNPCRP